MASDDKSSPEQNINPLYMATSRSENSTLNRLNSPNATNSPRPTMNQSANIKTKQPVQLLNRILPPSQDDMSDVATETLVQEDKKFSLLSKRRNNLLMRAKNVKVFNMVNCEEKIIFCVDISEEFQSSKIINGSLISFVKKFLAFFAAMRKLIKTTDEFALIILTDEAIWLCDFTNEIGNLLKSLDEITKCNPTECDLNMIFELLVAQMKSLATPAVLVNNAPNYIHRLILIYARSNTLPRLNIKKYGNLLRLENIFVDVIYVHEPLTAENYNQINEIYNQLNELDQRGSSYIFHLSEDNQKFQEYLARLTGHPLQRPNQCFDDSVVNADADH